MGNCGEKRREENSESRINTKQFKRQNRYREPMRGRQKILTKKCQGRENYTKNMRPMCMKKASKGRMAEENFPRKAQKYISQYKKGDNKA